MFHSAVIRLTGWYLLILMSISLLFSVATYNIATTQIHERLSEFQDRFEGPELNPFNVPNHRLYSAIRNDQGEAADKAIMQNLVFANLMVLFGGGALSYFLARRVLRDIEQSHEAQSRFTSDASHELRTPLAAMKTELEVALRDPTKLSKDDMHELLQSNLEEVERLTTLSQTLLLLSKLDFASLEFERIDLGSVIEEVVQRYDKNADRIVLTLPKSPIIIKANSASLEELFTILVDNALKYSPPKSKISAELSGGSRNAKFSISNGGKGIPEENLPQIFDRFYRADTSRTQGGTGLGLALAKEIVTMHKGELSVSSAKDKDTTFVVLLPISRKTKA
jgi:signal transduction histidine kinase